MSDLKRSAKKMPPSLKAELNAAIGAYLQACEHLIGAHERGDLPKEWAAEPHGEHCRFENLQSGHIIEAPFPRFINPRFDIDPYFFGVFVKTGPGFPLLKKAISHEFHDSLALLDQRTK
jgi:hypothetical protein